MAYTHGVKVSEAPTSILPPVEASASIPFIVGTAPINMTDAANVNKPVLCYTYEEAVKAFGYVPPVEDSASGLKKFEYSISEFIHSQFALFGVAPVIIVNVLDPTKHMGAITSNSITLDSKTGSATIAETGILADSITVTGEGAAYTKGTDYVTAFDDNGYLVVTSLKNADGDFRCTTGVAMTLAGNKVDPTKVSATEVVGGVDTSGNKSGFELIGECFARFRVVPGILLAPGFSSDATVAAIMAAKCANIDANFTAICLVDIPLDSQDYTKAVTWKNENNVVDPMQICCCPLLSLDGVIYHMSTQLAGVIGKTDYDNDDVPYVSPSNKNYQMTASVISDGTEIWLDTESAAYLNGNGIVTALNFIGGWKCWGNRTACYPANTDVKDAFIPVRRMFSWIGNTLVQTFWQNVDAPLKRRQIDTIVDSANIWLNGLTARQYILGGRVEFLDSENPTTDLMDGKARFHVYITPPSPNREIDFILEYDPTYLQNMFA